MVGKQLQRVCVATTHIPCKDCQGGLKRVGQVMALLSAAAALLKKNSEMVFSKSRLLDVFSSITCHDFLMCMLVNDPCSFFFSLHRRLQRYPQRYARQVCRFR